MLASLCWVVRLVTNLFNKDVPYFRSEQLRSADNVLMHTVSDVEKYNTAMSHNNLSCIMQCELLYMKSLIKLVFDQGGRCI